MEPEPPPITIVDPSHVADVMSGRPETGSRRLVLLGVVLALAGGVAVAADTLRDDRAADRSAVASLRITTDGAPDGTLPVGTVLIALRNDGFTAVRLLSARLLAPGYAVVPLHGRVLPGAVATLDLRDTATCGPTLLTDPASSVLVRLRTARGTVVTRSLPLSPKAYADVNRAARERCGYLSGDEAFSFQLTSVSVRGRAVVVAAQVANRSLLPLTLYRLLQMPGLRMTLSRTLPLALPVQLRPHVVAWTVPLQLQLQVSDCRVFLTSLGYPGLSLSDEVVQGFVVRGASLYEVPVLRFDPSRSSRADAGAVLTRLLEICPDVVIH